MTDRGPYIETFTNRRWHFADPRVEDVSLDDIAFALSNTNRFTGHAGVYSVASHSLHVARIVVEQMKRPELELQALMHDAHEAYVGDISAPLKRLLPDYRNIERHAELVVRKAFGLPMDFDEAVRQADLIALHDEASAFFGDVAHWRLEFGPSDFPVYAHRPDAAARLWRQAVERLSRRSDTIPAGASGAPWQCADCGHEHRGVAYANICIGCPCPRTIPAGAA